MATYTVTDPETGRTLKLTGDSPPTEEELMEIFGSQKPSRAGEIINSLGKFATRDLDVAGEAAAGINRSTLGIVDTLGSAANMAYGGLKGLGTLATGGSLNDAVSATRENPIPSIRNSDFMQERGIEGGFMEEGRARDAVRAGSEILPAAVGGMSAVRSAAQSLPQGMDKLDTVGQGVLRQFGKTRPADDVAGAIGVGVGGELGDMVGGDTGRAVGEMAGGLAYAPVRSGLMPPKQATREAADQVAANRFGAETAGKQADPNSRTGVMADPLATRAIDSGITPNAVATVKNANPSTREAFKRMTKIQRERLEGPSTFKGRPADVLGDNLKKRVDHVYEVNQTAAKRLDDAAEGLKGVRVDFEEPVSGFLANLQGLGVRIGDQGKITMDFSQSSLDASPAAKATLKRMVNWMGSKERTDGYGIHQLKQYIDEAVEYGALKSGLSGKADKAIKELRRNLNKALQDASPDYAEVNQVYSTTRQALDDLTGSVGKKINLFDDGAGSALGTFSRRISSNQVGRQEAANAIDGIDQMAKRFGGKFDDVLGDQVAFVNDLEKAFGSAAETSFMGQVSSGAAGAMSDAIRMAHGSPEGTIQLANKGFNILNRKTPEKAIAALEGLLNRY